MHFHQNGSAAAREVEAIDREHGPRRIAIIHIALLVGVTAVAFAPALRNEFVNWDDNHTLVHNESYRGLSADHLHWMFTTSHAGHYQPLSWVSFAIDWYAWRLEPFGYHLTNLVLHITTCVLFYFVALRLLATASKRETGVTAAFALFAATLFAIHPLRVESVAWATERRDVLSGAWLMASLLAYLKMVDARATGGRRAWLSTSLLCYVLSLLSKAAGITLPFLLLLLDWYPLQRTSGRGPHRPACGVARILREKLYYLAPAVAVGVLALNAQAEAGALRSLADHPLDLRIGQAFYGCIFYIRSTLWPVGLIPLYEQNPHATAFDIPNVVSAVIAIAISAICWRFRKRHPALLLAWASYIVLLAPVLGLAQSGQQIVADRYSYLSCTPWAILVAGAIQTSWHALSRRRPVLRWMIATACLGVSTTLVVLTRAQTRIWHDSVTLWKTVIHYAPETGSAHANLASAFNERGEFEQAEHHARRALSILPGNRGAHIALALSAFELGDLQTAERHYEAALAIRPVDPVRRIALAGIKHLLGKTREAESLYRQAIASNPEDSFLYVALASFLDKQDRSAEALATLTTALQVQPLDALARLRACELLIRGNQTRRAIKLLEEGLGLMPSHEILSAKLAWVLATTSEDDLRDATRALALTAALDHGNQPVLPALREAHAAALAATGDYAGAVRLIDRMLANDAVPLPDAMRQRLEGQLESYRAGRPVRE